jgi:hypothetical protein
MHLKTETAQSEFNNRTGFLEFRDTPDIPALNLVYLKREVV